ncbi:unnamed protein product [Closterium sp. NIES-65]|nr:unnamed protein product [Closterium sp. NIES-65]
MPPFSATALRLPPPVCLGILRAKDNNNLTCPDSYSSCGVPQDTSSGFCRTCPGFCNTCDKHKPLPWWAIAAIVAGAVLTAALAVLLYLYFFHKPPTSHVAAVSLDLFIATVIAAPLPVTSSLATPGATTFSPALFA